MIPIVEADCLKKSAAVIKVGLSRFRKPIGGLASVYHRWYSSCLKNSYNLAPVCRLYLPRCAKLRVPSDLCFDPELVNRLPNIQTEAELYIVMSEYFVGFPSSSGTGNYAHSDSTNAFVGLSHWILTGQNSLAALNATTTS